MKKFFLFMLFFAATTSSQANDVNSLIDAPKDEVLGNRATASTISYKCQQTLENTLSCEFGQMFTLREHKPENDKKAIEYGKKEYLNLSEEDKNTFKESCNDIKLYEQFFSKKISKQELLSKISEYAAIPETELDRMDNSSQQEFLKDNKDMSDYCANPNEANYLLVAGLAPRENSITCSSYLNKFKQTFKFEKNTGTWVSESDKAGECGNIRSSRFEKSDNSLWSFTVKNAVTDKKGNRNQSECPAPDNNEYIYRLSNNNDKPTDNTCHYLESEKGSTMIAVSEGGAQVNQSEVVVVTPYGELIPLTDQ